MARLDVSVIVVPTHGGNAVGTMISGLRPAPLTSVMLSGVMPSVNTDQPAADARGTLPLLWVLLRLSSGPARSNSAGPHHKTLDEPRHETYETRRKPQERTPRFCD